MNALKKLLIILGIFLFSVPFEGISQIYPRHKFKQLGEELPTPNVYRNAAGAPGHLYWQQKADYQIAIELNDDLQQIHGEEVITYHNYSPDKLNYIWIQLDQNVRHPESMTPKIQTKQIENMQLNLWSLNKFYLSFDGGFNIKYVKDENDNDYAITINHTMMRVDLKEPLLSGQHCKIKIKWWYNINDRMKYGGRSGYEYFPEDKNYIYTIAQFFPRMAVYNDVEGWQNKQFLGSGEFTLPFGDYDVKIKLPADMVVGATGELQNSSEMLTSTQLKRLEQSKTADNPIMIITEDEAKESEKGKVKSTKTWHYKAENVRDFAFAASRKFIWDAQGVQFDDKTVMAMSLYPKEGNPLWEKYSTKAVVHTLKCYSKYTFDYPYPVAYSVHSKDIGMEYPMICFNFGRPQKDGSYTRHLKYRMIGVIIHEVGHNYFPMIVNSDERQWTWMDEGLNTFLQYLTETEWEDETGVKFPSRRGPAENIVRYMNGDKRFISPIMTNSESIHQLGNNAYGKPATALNILRETIMGRELFDYAFKTYANRWKFKHPTPADFFRTMEDASAVDLDWFWHGWFYTTDHVDISINKVQEFQLTNIKPRKSKKRTERVAKKMERKGFIDPVLNSVIRNNEFSKLYTKNVESLTDKQRKILENQFYYYQVDFENIGGLIMPIILQFEYEDHSNEILYIPAEIWRKMDQVSKVFVSDKRIVKITLDPNKETADTDKSNNMWKNSKINIK
jgi:hypothetical protein